VIYHWSWTARLICWFILDTLFLLGTEIDWIHPELEIIIEQNTPLKTSAYGARGRITIKKIEKFRLKNHKS